MHPLMGHRRRLGWYAALWVPLAGLLVVLLHAGAGWALGPALGLAAGLAVAYAGLGLAVWFICRVLPLASNPWPAVGTHLMAAVVASGACILLARGLASAGAQAWPGMTWDLQPVLALLAGLGVLFYLLAAAGYYLVLGAEAAGAAQALAREAELRALKAQINPHFLFNSLNSISALTSVDGARAREMCILLGDFLRQTLALGGQGERAQVRLEEELELVRRYMAIEQVRFGARLRYEEAVEAGALAQAVPPLLLQPLVENAVVHGAAQMLECGWIRLEAASASGRLRLRVSNAYDATAPRRAGTGLGLANVRARLQARFGAQAAMQVAAADGCFSVALELPAEPLP